MVDHAVAPRGVDGEDRLHLRAYLLAIQRRHVDGVAHERHWLVRLGRRVRADVGGDDDVARQHVAVHPHARQLERARHRGDRAVAIGDEPDLLGARADPPQTADDAERRRVATGAPARGAGNDHAHCVGSSARTGQRRHLDGVESGRAERVRNHVAGDVRRIEQIERGEDGGEAHRRDYSPRLDRVRGFRMTWGGQLMVSGRSLRVVARTRAR